MRSKRPSGRRSSQLELGVSIIRLGVFGVRHGGNERRVMLLIAGFDSRDIGLDFDILDWVSDSREQETHRSSYLANRYTQ